MTYEQRVEQYGDVLIKFASLLVDGDGPMEELVAATLMLEVPESEKPLEFYFQQMYAKKRPAKGSWLFQQNRKKTKHIETFIPKERGTRRKKAWIRKLNDFKIQERVALFLHYYMGYGEGLVSEIMQTPIDSMRKSLYPAMRQFEKYMQGTENHYINETNFQKYFDEDFGSTYQARRRLKQIQIVAEMKKQKPVKKRRVPNWLPLAISAFVLLIAACVPISFHESKRMPNFDEENLEIAGLVNSMYQPYRYELSDYFGELVDYYVEIAAQVDYLEKQNKELTVSSEDEKMFYEMYKESFETEDANRKMYGELLGKYGYTIDEYIESQTQQDVFINSIYNEVSQVDNFYEMQQHVLEFNVQYADYIESVKERHSNEGIKEILASCEPFTVQFSDDMLEPTTLCKLPDGHVSYTYLGGGVDYFMEMISDLETRLDLYFRPYYYADFYTYLIERESLTTKEQEFVQYIQILAFTYEKMYPGIIKEVPPLKSEHLIFENS